VARAPVLLELPVDASVHTATGPDGADLVLLAHAAPEFVARRAARLVVGSGDGIFAARAARVQALGVGVEIVSRPASLSGALRDLHCPVHSFPDLPPDLRPDLPPDVRPELPGLAGTAVAA
jgi:hypothetical protein